MGVFGPQELAYTTWAFATASRSDALLFSALAKASERRMGDFIAQDLANMARAFAMVGNPSTSLLDPISVLEATSVQGSRCY